MNARSRGSITGSVLAVLIGLAVQASQPARAAHSAQYDEMNNYLSVREHAPTCIDQSVPAAERIAACTLIINLADYGSYIARQQIGTIYVARATAYQAAGNDQAALRDFETATMKEPGSELVWLGLGNFYLDKSEYARALESFDHAKQLGGNDRVFYVDRGVALTALKRYDEGLADFARAVALDPRDTAALSDRATLYLGFNRTSLAIADLSTVIRLEPANAKAYFNRGLAYERTDALDRAVADYRSAVRIEPSFGEAYEALGRALAKKDPQAGIAALSEAVRLDPRSPALKSRAILYLSLGRFDQAVRDLDHAIANDSDDEMAYLDRGVAEEEMGNLQMALADYGRSIHIVTSGAALVDRGSIYLRLGEREKALADFEAAIALEPNNVAALIGRANANYTPDERDPGRLAGSLGDFSRVIAASPKNAGAYYVRGDINFDLKQYAAAYSDFSESLELQPDQPAVLFNRALAAEHLGHSAEAAKDREAARKLDASMRGRAAREVAGSPTQVEYAAPRNTPQEPRVVFGAPLAAPEATPETTPETPSHVAGTPVPMQQVKIAGYRRLVVNGEERFCRTEISAGTHLQSTRCYSREEVAAQQEAAKQYLDGIHRLSGLQLDAGCTRSAASSCIGMQGGGG